MGEVIKELGCASKLASCGCNCEGFIPQRDVVPPKYIREDRKMDYIDSSAAKTLGISQIYLNLPVPGDAYSPIGQYGIVVGDEDITSVKIQMILSKKTFEALDHLLWRHRVVFCEAGQLQAPHTAAVQILLHVLRAVVQHCSITCFCQVVRDEVHQDASWTRRRGYELTSWAHHQRTCFPEKKAIEASWDKAI